MFLHPTVQPDLYFLGIQKYYHSVPIHPYLLRLISHVPEERFAFGNVSFVLETFRTETVHDSQDGSTLLRLCHDNFDRVRSRTVDAAHLGHGTYAPQDVDRVHVPHEDDKGVTGTYGHGILLGQSLEFGIGARPPDQTDVRSLTKGETEFGPRDTVEYGLVEVLDRLDEMGVAQNKIEV